MTATGLQNIFRFIPTLSRTGFSLRWCSGGITQVLARPTRRSGSPRKHVFRNTPTETDPQHDSSLQCPRLVWPTGLHRTGVQIDTVARSYQAADPSAPDAVRGDRSGL